MNVWNFGWQPRKGSNWSPLGTYCRQSTDIYSSKELCFPYNLTLTVHHQKAFISGRVFQAFSSVTLLPFFFPSHCPKGRCRWLWVPGWQMEFFKWRSWEEGDTQESCQKPLSFPWSSNALTTSQERKPFIDFSLRYGKAFKFKSHVLSRYNNYEITQK